MANAKSATPERSAGFMSVVAGIERIAFSLCLFLVPVVFATGFSRYEYVKLATLEVGGGLVLLCWLVIFVAGKAERRLGGGKLAIAGWLLVLLAAGSLAWTPLSSEGWLRLSFWLLLMAVFTSAASQHKREAWVVLPLLLAGAVVGLTVIGHQIGVAFPPVIPTGMHPSPGPHGTFDHAFFAAAFLAVVVPLALFWAARADGRTMTILSAASALIASFAVGLAGGLAVVVLGICVLLGTIASARGLRDLERRKGVGVWALAVLSLGLLLVGKALPASTESDVAPDASASIPLETLERWFPAHQLEHWENAVTTADEWTFERDRVFEQSAEYRWLGTGAGGWIVEAGRGIDTDSSYYRDAPDGYHLHDIPPGQLLGVLSELGLVGLIFWGVFFLGALYAAGRGFSSRDAGGGFLAISTVAAVVLGASTSAGFHAGEATVFMAVIGLAVSFDRRTSGVFSPRSIPPVKNKLARLERLILIALPAGILLLVGGWETVRALASDLQYQRGVVFFGADVYDEGFDALESSEQTWRGNAMARYHLALARYYLPTDETRREAGRRTIRSGASLRPTDVRYQLLALRIGVLGGAESIEDGIRTTRTRVERLRALQPLDPANDEIYLQLADAHKILRDYEGAAVALIELTREARDVATRARAFEALGRLYQNDIEDPERALRYYREAGVLYSDGSSGRRSVEERILEVEQWIETGTEPHGH